MSLISFANDELDRIGMVGDMRKHILHMVDEFAKEGHSGFSASYALGVLEKLLAFKPLSPLTGNDDEWVEVASGVFQNKRCSRVFRQADRFNGQAYDIDGIVFTDKNGTSYTSSESLVPVAFPYTPTTKYVQVE